MNPALWQGWVTSAIEFAAPHARPSLEAIVPEPAAILLAGVGLIALGMWRRRKR